MLFSTYTFAVFFAVVLLLYRRLPDSAGKTLLLVASYVFYGSWDYRYAGLILLSTCIDYWAGLQIDRSQGRRRVAVLLVSLCANLGILGTFKYYDFFIGSLRGWLGVDLPLLELVLPVGISFYTFQSMSYTIDVYRAQCPPTRSFRDFALFVSFFPQLVAGPIVRAVDFLPQLVTERPPDLRAGFLLFLGGLFKKLVFADNLGTYVAVVHEGAATASATELWASAYAFAFQIYFDFSGYSEMAVGLALMMGFRFPVNFRHPYIARNVSDFWRRWHITLSSWLRDYLFISMGGSRSKLLVTLRNLMITMVLGGLWHGANWTFVVWGFLHGSFLVLHRLLRPRLERSVLADSRAWLWMSIALTFHCWVISMVFFRAADVGTAWSMLQGMFSASFTAPDQATRWVLIGSALLYVLHVVSERFRPRERFDQFPLLVRAAVLALMILSIAVFSIGQETPFIYFQF